MSSRKTKKRDIQNQIAIAGLILTAIACIAAVVVVPEVRVWFKLDFPPSPLPESVQADPANLMDFFPMHIGAQWTYQYSQFTEPASASEDDANPRLGQFTQTVAVLDTGLSDRIKVVGLKVSGENFLNFCIQEGNQPYSGDLETWLVIDSSSLYRACSRQEAYAIARERLSAPDKFALSSGALPMFQAPFEVGKVWPAFPDLPPRDDTAYQWLVESQVDVTLPAGEFKDCYRILLRTMPDTTVRWVCPGVGLVAEEYHHNGAINDYSYELQAYTTRIMEE